MLFRSYAPTGPLRGLVEDFWLYEDYAGAHARERILPSGTFEMVFNLQEDELRIYGPSDDAPCRRFAGALISGPYAGSFMSDAAEERAILGVHFRPGGAFAALGVPGREIANKHVDLCAIWGTAASVLRERLCSRTEPMERFRLLEGALTDRLPESPRRHPAVGAALSVLTRNNGRAKVRDVAGAVELTERRLAELFTAEVGLTPKLFGRIQRFQRAVALARSAAEVDWAEIALDCGYYDQPHLIRDFVAFAGVTPADFLRRHRRFDRAGVHVKRHHLPLAA